MSGMILFMWVFSKHLITVKLTATGQRSWSMWAPRPEQGTDCRLWMSVRTLACSEELTPSTHPEMLSGPAAFHGFIILRAERNFSRDMESGVSTLSSVAAILSL